MVERMVELRRRRARKKKITKLKAKLEGAKTPADREILVKKIKQQSPWWVEPAPAK